MPDDAPPRRHSLLSYLPNLLGSRTHLLVLILLGLYLLPGSLLGIVSTRAELIGGNYTNVVSAIGACVASILSARTAARTRTSHRVGREAHEAVLRIEQWLALAVIPGEPPPRPAPVPDHPHERPGLYEPNQ